MDLKIYKDKGGDNQEPGLAYQVVMDLMRVYLDQNHYLSTLIRNVSYLEKQNTFASGTIRSNYGQFLDEFKNATLSRGE